MKSKIKNYKNWLHGLVGATIGGGASAITNMLVAPDTFNLQEGWKKLVTSLVVSGLLSAALYLKQSPLPDKK